MKYDTTRRDFLKYTANGAAAIAAAAAWGRAAQADAAPDAVLETARQQVAAGNRQLFLDDVMIEQATGVRRVLHQPKKYEKNPIIRQGQTAWNEYRSQLYGTVLYMPEEQKFKMWYLSGARLPGQQPIMLDGVKRIPNYQLLGYAESTDGFEWTLPNLGLVDYNGSKENNICRISRTNAEGVAVVYDRRDSDAGRRYKAFYWEHSASEPEPAPGINGMSYSYSADGKSWTDHPDNPVIALGSDTGQQALWDEDLQKYVVYGRFGAGGRKVARADSDDFVNWSSPKLVFDADSGDPPGTQIYGMGVSRYEGVYIGMPWMFHITSTHRIDVQLTTSRDGRKWSRAGDYDVFIPNGPEGSWDAGIIFTASQPVQVKDDRMFIFYSASAHDHNYAYIHADPNKKGTPEWIEMIRKVGTSIGVATLRRDGFVSLDAGDPPGEVTTRSFTWPEKASLRVNADATGGSVLVKVLDADQLRIESVPLGRITGDQPDILALPQKVTKELAGRQVRLQFRIQDASLYSWWLVGG